MLTNTSCGGGARNTALNDNPTTTITSTEKVTINGSQSILFYHIWIYRFTINSIGQENWFLSSFVHPFTQTTLTLSEISFIVEEMTNDDCKQLCGPKSVSCCGDQAFLLATTPTTSYSWRAYVAVCVYLLVWWCEMCVAHLLSSSDKNTSLPDWTEVLDRPSLNSIPFEK